MPIPHRGDMASDARGADFQQDSIRKAELDLLRQRRTYSMISTWWTLFAFIGGGCAGVLLIALMRVAADAGPRSVEFCPIRSDGA